MQFILYNIIIKLLISVMRLGALIGKEKFKKGLQGRSHQKELLKKIEKRGEKPLIWLHAASLGEYEQAQHLLALIHQQYPNYDILLSFFSPSGYEHVQCPQYIQYLCYIPFDLRSLAQSFIKQIRPNLVVFVKYELWLNHLYICRKHKIPIILIGAIEHNNRLQKWYSYFHRQALLQFNYIFTQDEQSSNILANFYPKEQLFTVGDPRIDRIQKISQDRSVRSDLSWIDKFKQNKLLFIGGSLENSDLPLLALARQELHTYYKSILVPHEVSTNKIKTLQKIFPNSLLLSEIKHLPPEKLTEFTTIIVDSIGLLCALYSYTQICYIGGAWKKPKLHNIMEPVSKGNFVIVGDNFNNFKEARDLASMQYIYPLKTMSELKSILIKITNKQIAYAEIGTKAKQFLMQMPPCCPQILQIMQAKDLL